MKKYILSIIALAVICLELIWAVSCINKWRNIYSWNALQSGDTPTSWSSEEHDIKLHIDKNPLTKRTSMYTVEKANFILMYISVRMIRCYLRQVVN